jgi:hypothetical protein
MRTRNARASDGCPIHVAAPPPLPHGVQRARGRRCGVPVDAPMSLPTRIRRAAAAQVARVPQRRNRGSLLTPVAAGTPF